MSAHARSPCEEAKDMSENPVDSVSQAISGKDPAKSTNLIYILYLVGLLVPVVPIIGVVLAYLYRKDMTGWLESHNTFQIRTFWIALLFGVVALLLTFVIIGWLLYVGVVVWLIIRCVKGLQAVGRKEPVADPYTWMF
jgi:uncharacterized membrane protein